MAYTFPSFSITRLSEYLAPGFRSWIPITAEILVFFTRDLTVSITFSWCLTSWFEVGSSRRRISGSWQRALAISDPLLIAAGELREVLEGELLDLKELHHLDDLIDILVRYPAAVEKDRTLGLEDPVDALDEGGFAGAIGAHDAENL